MRGEVSDGYPVLPLRSEMRCPAAPGLSIPALHPEERSYDGQWLTYSLLQVLHLHIGQAGTQLGNSAWELYVS